MMSTIIYITPEQARETHAKTIKYSGGGTLEEIDFGRLESVLYNIQNDDWYPTFVDKLTHLFFCTCQFHCFADGNKRLAITLSTLFLLLNGYLKVAQTFLANRLDMMSAQDCRTQNRKQILFLTVKIICLFMKKICSKQTVALLSLVR